MLATHPPFPLCSLSLKKQM
uniref:Uncharacterized protein n=1 Tax=Arundo donax TaxID=35708 RepID=A0A0A9BL88_ARUDO